MGAVRSGVKAARRGVGGVGRGARAVNAGICSRALQEGMVHDQGSVSALCRVVAEQQLQEGQQANVACLLNDLVPNLFHTARLHDHKQRESRLRQSRPKACMLIRTQTEDDGSKLKIPQAEQQSTHSSRLTKSIEQSSCRQYKFFADTF